jgi:branched-chain amino acid aminotransferase
MVGEANVPSWVSISAGSPVQVNVDGQLVSAEQPTLSPLNRSFLYGDSIYEVWRSYHNRLFAWKEHWRRLHRSAHALHLNIPWTEEHLLGQIKRTAAAFRESTKHTGDLYVRLQIHRGGGVIGLDVDLADEEGYVILVQPVPTLSKVVRTGHGLSLSVARNIRRNPTAALNPAWKTGNYLNNIIGLQEARERGADDVLFLNTGGEVTEASTSNIAFISGTELITPPLSSGILAGITRDRIVRETAAKAGLRVVERQVMPGELGGFEEAMLFSTTKDVVPVGRIDDHHYRVTGEAAAWLRLKAAFAEAAQGYAEDHPELAV